MHLIQMEKDAEQSVHHLLEDEHSPALSRAAASGPAAWLVVCSRSASDKGSRA